jgi:rhodanese-related sulfurtransferase
MEPRRQGVEFVRATEVQERRERGLGPLLVCAFKDEREFQAHRLLNAISASNLESIAPFLAKDKEIVFYGIGELRAEAVRLAEHYRDGGYENVKLLDGDADSWKAAGL